MQTGLGVKTKVLEAMAMGLPVIGTPLAFNGIQAPQGVVVCDSAREFADCISALISDLPHARALGEAGRTFVSERYSMRVAINDMLAQLRSLDTSERQ
jgi:glycosyltransferase involved in cell wall biosynthesis